MTWKTLAAAAAFALAALVPAGAAAQDQTRTELAGELVALLEMEETLNNMFAALTPLVAASARAEMNLRPSEEARLTEILTEEFQGASPEMLQSVVDVYAANMSEQELRETVGFLQSPSGRALVDTQNSAQAELERIGERIGARVAMRGMAGFIQERAEQ